MERQESHAYACAQLTGKTWVYYSTIFPPFAKALERLKTGRPDLVQAFSTAYEVWIAYHAILQKQRGESASYAGDADKMEEMLDVQRAVVATMQVKQALQFAELWRKNVAAVEA